MIISAWFNNGEKHVIRNIIQESANEDSDHFLVLDTNDNKSYVLNMNNINCVEIVKD